VVVELLRLWSRTDLDLARGNCTCCTDDEEEFSALQKPLATATTPHNSRASQAETQMQFPLERPKSTQMQSLTHTTTCALVGGTIPD